MEPIKISSLPKQLVDLILSDPKTGNWYLILIIYVNYIKFDELCLCCNEEI